MTLSVVTLAPSASRADNPIVQTLYTADPAPYVHDGRVYLYTTHDEDTLVNDFFTMNDWRVYSSTDIVNWTDHGSPLRYSDFSWARGDAWAGQVIHKNGKFYFYVPVTSASLGRRAMWLMTFSGVFERHPKLKLVMTELPGTWWDLTISDMDGAYFNHRAGLLRETLPKKPSVMNQPEP